MGIIAVVLICLIGDMNSSAVNSIILSIAIGQIHFAAAMESCDICNAAAAYINFAVFKNISHIRTSFNGTQRAAAAYESTGCSPIDCYTDVPVILYGNVGGFAAGGNTHGLTVEIKRPHILIGTDEIGINSHCTTSSGSYFSAGLKVGIFLIVVITCSAEMSLVHSK